MLNINTEIRKTNINKMVSYAEQAEEIKQQFQQSRDKAESDISAHQEAIQNQQKVVAETYESYVLDISTLEDYKAEQDKLKSLQDTLQAVQGKLASLDAVQKKKINAEVFQPMKEIRGEAQKELRKIQAEKKAQLLQMKTDYLKAVNDLGRDLVVAESAVNTKMDYIRHDAGESKNVYSSGAVQPVIDMFTHTDGYSPRKILTVTASDISVMLGTGKVTGNVSGRIKEMTGISPAEAPEAVAEAEEA